MWILKILIGLGALLFGEKAFAGACVADLVLTVASNCGPESAAGGLGAGAGAVGGGCSDADEGYGGSGGDGAGSGDTLVADAIDSVGGVGRGSYDSINRMREEYRNASSRKREAQQAPPSSGQANSPSHESSGVNDSVNKQGPAPSTIQFPESAGHSDSGEASV